jgi:1-acyl-sn-glycerol-3-phosphate acyltransferase
MAVGRTAAAWTWLVVGTVVWGTLLVLLAPLDRRGTLRWRCVRAWALGLSVLMGLKRLEVVGRERLAAASGTLLMMNHTSGIDIMAVIRASDRPVAFAAKRGLFLVPFFGWYMAAARMVSIDRRNRERAVASLDRAGERLAQGETLLIFPEGTRSRVGKLLPFKKGGFILAHSRGLPILPMVIAGARDIHAVGFWVRGGGPVAIVVDEPIDTTRFDDVASLMAYTRGRFARCAGRAARRLERLKAAS